jgi:predicted Ser/Thr protein kinase
MVPDLLADEAPLAAGATIGSYRIERELGRGGMGRVYLAFDSRLGRRVALKALAPHLVGDRRQRERLKREARAAALLTHPGICTVYALEEIDGSLYIATEFVDGRTLRAEIQGGSLPSASEVLQTARELASALAAAHAAGVVHRDLKPENVMRTAAGRLKILDFGLADIEHPDRATVSFASQPGAVMGTPAYMAPEQINGEPVDARADIFAFGVLMYEYASGTHPFHASNPLAIVGRVLNSDVAPLPSSGVESGRLIDHVITRCLQKTPAQRYASGADLVSALNRDSSPAPLPGRHTTWWRVHQVIIFVLYVAGAANGWRIKAWLDTALTLGLFLALGAATTLGGVLRGHLMFTERVNPRGFARERRRTAPALRAFDLIVAALMVGDGLAIAGRSALTAAVTLSLGLGLAAAALVLEPSTTAAAFGDDHDRD